MQKIDSLHLNTGIQKLYLQIALGEQRLKDNCLTQAEQEEVRTEVKSLQTQLLVQQGRCLHGSTTEVGAKATQCMYCGAVQRVAAGVR